jgi:hypothetical protein
MRSDEAACKLQLALSSDEDPELRFMAGAGVEAQKRLAAASAPGGHLWSRSYTALAAGRGRQAAMDWALAQFSKLDPAGRVEVMGTWLASDKPAEK